MKETTARTAAASDRGAGLTKTIKTFNSSVIVHSEALWKQRRPQEISGSNRELPLIK